MSNIITENLPLHWTFKKYLVTFILLISSFFYIMYSSAMLAEGVRGLKSLIITVLIIFHIGYVLSLFTLKKNKHWNVWAGTYVVLLIITALFTFYGSVLIK